MLNPEAIAFAVDVKLLEHRRKPSTPGVLSDDQFVTTYLDRAPPTKLD